MPENSPQSFTSSTPIHSSNVCLLPPTQVRDTSFHTHIEAECVVSTIFESQSFNSSLLKSSLFQEPQLKRRRQPVPRASAMSSPTLCPVSYFPFIATAIMNAFVSLEP